MDKFERQVQMMEEGKDITPKPGAIEKISTFTRGLFERWEALTKDEFEIQNSHTKEILEFQIWQIFGSLHKLYIKILGEEDPQQEAKLIWNKDMVFDPAYSKLCAQLKEEKARIERVLRIRKGMQGQPVEEDLEA